MQLCRILNTSITVVSFEGQKWCTLIRLVMNKLPSYHKIDSVLVLSCFNVSNDIFKIILFSIGVLFLINACCHNKLYESGKNFT